MVADQGRAYLVEDRYEATEQQGLPEDCEEHEWAGRRLFVIDLSTGSVLQKVRLEEASALSGVAVAVHDGRVFLSDYEEKCIFVLNMAHSTDSLPEANAPSTPLHDPEAPPYL